MINKCARFNYLICIYLLGMVFFTAFRIAETAAYCAQTSSTVQLDGLYWKALWMGFRFDTTVSCYLLALPLVLMIVGEMARIRVRGFYAFIHYLLMALYSVAFFACAADIPYFCYFFNRLDAVALSWTEDFGTSASMIFSEPKYWLYIGLFFAAAVSWWLLGRILYKRLLLPNLEEHLPYAWSIPLTTALLCLGFIGMRGKLSKIPIRVGTAYFCNNPFLNQIGLNPVFTFAKSIEDSGKSRNQPVELIDLATAQTVVQDFLSQPTDDSILAQGRMHLPEGTNVVLVLMESMSAEKTSLASEKSLSPCLDSLMALSLTFSQAWSAGIHTHNGIYSSLYGHPAILSRHLMRSSPIPQVCGLPQRLHEAGYSTTFLLAHDEDFDGMRGFLYQNGFDRVVGQRCYPKHEVVGTWGIPDHSLFDHALEHCDSIAKRGPFFTTIMTVSDHGPYILPKDIELVPRSKTLEEQVAEYADWSIGRFIRMARQREWFDNTLFIFIADHGASLCPTYDLPLAYNHVPLLFYAPGCIAPETTDRLALQLDLPATILGMLGLPCGDKMLGIDLMSQRRKYAYFSADDKIGVVDGELFYLYKYKQQRASLYRYREGGTEDLIEQYPEQADDMRRYAFSMIQASQQMLQDGTTQCPPPLQNDGI